MSDRAPLILASSSPRRRELLAMIGIRCEVDPSHIDEAQLPDESPRAMARRLAREKALDVANRHAAAGDTRPVLAADTIVVVDDEAIGKPRDRDDARAMIERLSGRAHDVISALCLIAGDDEHAATVTTRVTFKTLDSFEIERYLECAAWHDKAGAYAVQEHAAYMVARVDGSYTNVVGLPLAETVDALASITDVVPLASPAEPT
ncbi:MAG: septum formation protein Maf [Myxococcales bacterium]|nr:septum formation protein Maf [Myxococcales bacterium]